MSMRLRASGAVQSLDGRQAVLAAAALGSGAALLLAIFTHVSLALALALFGLVAALTTAAWCLRVPAEVRAVAARRALYGAAGGVVATLAYDVARLLVVTLLRLHVQPFATWVLFGQLIVGGGPGPRAWVAGAAYHYVNGVLFAVAYSLLLSGRGWWFGPAWGLGLECLMLLVYPAWLDLRLLMVEFTVMSLAGHLAYGATLGLLNQRRPSGWRRTPRRVVR
jgi:hypothetical protein